MTQMSDAHMPAREGVEQSLLWRWLIPLGGLVLCGVGAFAVLSYVLAATSLHTDFAQDYYAARALWSGESIYTSSIEGVKNNHPPLVALFSMPLALLPYPAAFLLWSLISLVCYIGCLGWTICTLGIRVAPRWVLLILGAGLCWYPFLAQMALGQLSVFVAACLVTGWVSLRSGREELAGGLFGFAAALKLFPGLVVVYLLVRGKWRALTAFAAGAVFLSLVPMVLVGPSEYVRYITEIAPANAARYAVFPTNVSITGVVSRLLVSGPWVEPVVDAPAMARVLTLGASLVILMGLIRRLRRMPPTLLGDDAGLAYVCIAMIMLSPISWQHIFSSLILPFGLLVCALQNGSKGLPRMLILMAFVLLSLPDIELARALMDAHEPYRMSWYAALLLIAPTIGLTMLWMLLDRLVIENHGAYVQEPNG